MDINMQEIIVVKLKVIYFNKVKNIKYENISTDTDHIGPLKDLPSCSPHSDAKNKLRIK
jgi:hypothetical protein